MPNFKRSRLTSWTFFFTLVTNQRWPLLSSDAAVANLRRAFKAVRCEHAFDLPAAVILPDHLHILMTLPVGDDDYSTRICRIKVHFTRLLPADVRSSLPVSASRAHHRESAVLQRRFWEHTIRDEDDFNRHVDYIHYNPVRHGFVKCPHEWPWSSFHRWVRTGAHAKQWGCSCEGRVKENVDDGPLARQYGE